MIWRLVAGFLLAPVIPSILVVVLMDTFTSQWINFWGEVAFVLMIAESASVLLGVPAFLLLRRWWGKIGLIECVVSGGTIGLVVGVLGLIVGTLSGALFWAIAIRGDTGPNPALNTDAVPPQRAG